MLINRLFLGKSIAFVLVISSILPSLVDTPLQYFDFLIVSLISLACALLYVNSIAKNPLVFLFFASIALLVLHLAISISNIEDLAKDVLRFGTLLIIVLNVHHSYPIELKDQIKTAAFVIWIFNFIFFVLYNSCDIFARFAFNIYYNNPNFEEFYGYFLTRFGGTFGNPNALGISTVFLASVFFGEKTIAAKLSFAMTLAVLLATQSRTAAIVFAIMLFVYYGIRDFKLYITIFVAISLIASFLSLLGYVEIDFLMERYFFSINLAGRVELWQSALPALTENLTIFLIGRGAFKSEFLILDNEYLVFFIQFGIVGFLCFVFVLISLLLIACKSFYMSEGKLLLAQTLGFCAASLAASPLTMLKTSVVLVIVLSTQISLLKRRRRS